MRRKFLFAGLSVVLVLLAVCLLYPFGSSVDARIGYLNAYASLWSKVGGTQYAIVGDSIMRGDGMWFLPLGTSPLQVANLARGGFPTRQLLPIARQATALHPDVVLYMSGTNDVGTDQDEQSPQSFREMLAILTAGTSRVIVTLPPPTARPDDNIRLQALRARFSEIANEAGVEIIDLWPAFEKDGAIGAAFTTDGTHLTDAAYAVWYAALRDQLSRPFVGRS